MTSAIISYFQYVFFKDGGGSIDAHSGVRSPAITLDPQYNNDWFKRRKALRQLFDYYADWEMARRAVDWIAESEEDLLLRDIANDFIKARSLPEGSHDDTAR